MVAICGPPPCTTTGLMAVCSKQNDVARERLGEVFGAHGMAAIFDDDGFLVILLHMRQRLGQDAGLIERTDVWRVGHEAGLVSQKGWGGFYLIGGRGAKHKQPVSDGAELRRGHAAATASTSQLTINSVPPVGAAIGNRLWPAYCRSVRSPANNAAATTKPHAAAIPIAR